MAEHPQLRNRDRQVNLVADTLHKCTRIAFFLPREGNENSYMVIDKGAPNFGSILFEAMGCARAIKRVESQEYQEYLRLQKKFEGRS